MSHTNTNRRIRLAAGGALATILVLERTVLGLDVVDAAVGGVRRRGQQRDRNGRERGESDADPPGGAGECQHRQIPSMAKSIGSTLTFSWASLSRNLGRRPVARRRPRLRPFSSKPIEWS